MHVATFRLVHCFLFPKRGCITAYFRRSGRHFCAPSNRFCMVILPLFTTMPASRLYVNPAEVETICAQYVIHSLPADSCVPCVRPAKWQSASLQVVSGHRWIKQNLDLTSCLGCDSTLLWGLQQERQTLGTGG